MLALSALKQSPKVGSPMHLHVLSITTCNRVMALRLTIERCRQCEMRWEKAFSNKIVAWLQACGKNHRFSREWERIPLNSLVITVEFVCWQSRSGNETHLLSSGAETIFFGKRNGGKIIEV